jgi:hypothetical protein
MLAGCRDDPVIGDTNLMPVAEARVISRTGESVDETTDGGSLTFDFAGAPVAITLDGTHSRDPDGPNGLPVHYRWLSGTLTSALAADAGSDAAAPPPERWVPPDAGPDWPADEQRPTVQLGEGIWSFTLWVADDKGSYSEPDTITVTVGSVVNPAIGQCIETVLPTVQQACKECICGVSDTCRTAADQSVCNADCWGLVGCIRMNCPNFVMTMDTACVTMNCGAFLAGAAASRMVAPCVTQCESACASMPAN